MTSDDEMEAAQVVANWLRELADRYPCGVPLEEFLGSIDVGVLAGHCDYLLDSDDVGSVAELIDPTCELVELWDGERGEYRLDCTACHFGELAGELRDEDPDMYNSRNLWRDVDWQLLRHCPYCGARVVRPNGD